MVNKFKGISGHWRTRTLFEDVARHLGGVPDDAAYKPIYWLNSNTDGDKRQVLRTLFVNLRDPTGVELANKYLGGWDHLQTLLKSKWFKESWDEWIEELYQTDRAERLAKIRLIAEEEGPQAFQASKYLANREYESTPSKRGRPSKEEISGNLKNEILHLTQLEEDNQRMTGLTLIHGGKK